MTEPSVAVTVGRLGGGEKTVELEPGESLQETFDGPGYVEVAVPEVEADGEGLVTEVAGTTHEQDESATSDRVITQKRVSCSNCGVHYLQSFSRCPECGTPNTSA
jgi:hypothetical protein